MPSPIQTTQRGKARRRLIVALFCIFQFCILFSTCVRPSTNCFGMGWFRPKASDVLQNAKVSEQRFASAQVHIYNIHCFNPFNAGDVCSAPVLYWETLRETRKPPFNALCANSTILDISNVGDQLIGEAALEGPGIVPDRAPIIVGGGGLLSQDLYKSAMMNLASRTGDQGPVVFWGVGLNSYDRADITATVPVLPGYVSQADLKSHILVGARDYDPSGKIRWVPCCSCLNKALDTEVPSTQPKEDASRLAVLTSTVPEGNAVAKYLDGWIAQGLLNRTDVFSNRGTEMGPIISFMRRYDVIVTSSYHATYWATLLGKKVIVCDVWSSKFSWMKHPPTIYSGDIQADVASARCYPFALEEARAATFNFANDVFELFGACSS